MLKEIKEFYESTKFHFGDSSLQSDFQYPLNWVKIFFKTYPRFPKIKLSEQNRDGELKRLLAERQSKREFSGESSSFSDIEEILYFSLGIREQKNNPDETRRFYPSAGARFPIEAYLIANRVSQIKPGLYHYNIKYNELETLIERDLTKESSAIFADANKGNPNFLILTGVMSRTEVKYGINAYRFALIESGHIGQNLSLLCTQKGLGCCALGGFDNDQLVKLLDIGEDEIPLYAFSIGKTK